VAAVIAHFGLDERGAISAVLVAALAVLSAFDLRFRVIPNRIVLPAAALVLALQLVLFSDDAVEWLAAGFGGALVMLLPGLIRPGAIGFGDVKLTLLLGFGLGGSIITALLLGSLCAVPVALWILVRGGMEARKEAIPLGPFLAFGGFLALLISDSL
jgi:prepilin signal peptidase PulO-like enzyme (type II secretory pathway)